MSAQDDAMAFLKLLPEGSRAPYDYRHDDGETGFYWKSENKFLDVSFFGDGKIVYYGYDRSGGGCHEVMADAPFDRSSLSGELLDMIGVM